jgi:hypothetical protein
VGLITLSPPQFNLNPTYFLLQLQVFAIVRPFPFLAENLI